MKILMIFIMVLVFPAACGVPPAAGTAFAQEGAKEEEAFFVAKKAFQDGFYDVSLGLLERFLKSYPSSAKAADADLLIGQCYFHQNRFLDALEKFESLLKEPNAKNIQDAVLYWIAEVHFKGNNFSRAAEYYKKIIDEIPSSAYAVSAYYSLGWCQFQEAKFAEALKYFKAVEEKFSQESLAQDSSFKIIQCLYNLKEYAALKDKARSYLKQYSKDTAKVPYLYFYLAEADYYLNNFNEAIDEYSKVVVAKGDEKIQGLSNLGITWAYLRLKQFKQAQDVLSAINPEALEKSSRDVLLLAKAMLSLETKQLTEAKSVYEELANTTQDPLVLIQAHLGKAEVLYTMAEYKESISMYKKALEKLPESATQELIDKVHYGLAWAYLKEGEFKSAIEEFQKIAKQSPDKVVKIAALCQIGDTYQDSGDYVKAVEQYDVILKEYPDSFYSDYVQYQVGLTFLKDSRYDGAILAFQKLKNNYPNSKLVDDATYALGLAYFQREDYATSKEIFEKFQQEFKDSSLRSQGIYLLGTSLYNMGTYAGAIEVFKEIVRSYSQDVELCQKAEYEIADCYYQMGNEKEAMARFTALRSKYPDSTLTVEVMWWLGEYYYRQKDFNLARRYFSSLIQDFPKSSLLPDAYYALGSINEEESVYDEAVKNFEKVMEFGKSDLAGTAAIAIADIYTKQQKLDLALGTYKRAVRDNANLAGLIYPKIGDIFFKMNDYDSALDYYRKSMDTVPVKEMSSIQFKIAEVLQAQKKPQEAIEAYLKVTYLYAENSDLVVKSFLRVAAIFEDAENFKEALNVYKKIASMDVQEAKYAQERMDWIRAHVK